MTNTIPTEPGFYGVMLAGIPHVCEVYRLGLITRICVARYKKTFTAASLREAHPEATFGPKLELFPEVPEDVTEAIDHLRDLAEFAYENGFHEIGYQPVERIANYIKRGAK